MRERGVAIWDIPREREEDAELFSPAQLSVDGIDQVSDARGFTGLINQWLRDDIGADRKQLHTAKHVFDRLHEEHSFTGDYTIVKNYMRERERRSREMFVLLSHPPGEAMVVIGGVEGLVGYRRRNFMAPVPHFLSWDEFNTWLEEQCRKRQADTLPGHSETIGQRLERGLAAITDLPAAHFDARDQTSGRVN